MWAYGSSVHEIHKVCYVAFRGSTNASWFYYLQALTRVFTPLQQWLYFDAVECLPSAPPAPEDRLPCGSRYDHQIALFGREFQDKLGSLQVLQNL